METYRMVSPDYPKDTFVYLEQIVDKAKSGFVVQLPLPSQVTYQSSFNWNADEVPIVAQKIIDSATSAHKAVVSDTNGFMDYIISVTPKIIENLDNNTSEAGKASLQKMFLNSVSTLTTTGKTAAQYFYKNLGLTYNPNKQLFFNGVDHRQLNISFDIVPQNKEQSKACATAIKKIRIASSPSYESGGAFFTYPSYFNLCIRVNGVDVLSYNKFAITSINTNLSPSGMMSWHADGTPVAYTLEINGIESEIPTNNVESKRKFLGIE